MRLRFRVFVQRADDAVGIAVQKRTRSENFSITFTSLIKRPRTPLFLVDQIHQCAGRQVVQFAEAMNRRSPSPPPVCSRNCDGTDRRHRLRGRRLGRCGGQNRGHHHQSHGHGQLVPPPPPPRESRPPGTTSEIKPKLLSSIVSAKVRRNKGGHHLFGRVKGHSSSGRYQIFLQPTGLDQVYDVGLEVLQLGVDDLVYARRGAFFDFGFTMRLITDRAYGKSAAAKSTRSQCLFCPRGGTAIRCT